MARDCAPSVRLAHGSGKRWGIDVELGVIFLFLSGKWLRCELAFCATADLVNLMQLRWREEREGRREGELFIKAERSTGGLPVPREMKIALILHASKEDRLNNA